MVDLTHRKRHGVHYTPPALAAFLAQRAVRALRVESDDPVRVLDPACGDGELLVAAWRALRAAGHRRVELVGCDVDRHALTIAEPRLAELGCAAELRCQDLVPGHDEPGGYQLVITNPPYVRTQVLGARAAAVLARRYRLHGRVDLTHAFVAAAAELLADGGALGLLCSNRFLSTLAGANVRRLLTEGYTVREVYDLGDSKLFPAASVLPAIVTGTAGRPRSDAGPARFVSTYQQPAAAGATRTDLYAALLADRDTTVAHHDRRLAVNVGTLHVEPGPDHGAVGTWRQARPASTRWAAGLRRATWRTFGEVARVRVGIKSTADGVFISDDWQRLPIEQRPEPELLRPLLTHRDVRAWCSPAAPATRVLYPYRADQRTRRVVDLADFPRAGRYLERHADRLRARQYVVDAGRAWFELWVPHRPTAWAEPKIVFPDISVTPRFAVDRSGAVVNGDCYWISFADLPDDGLGYLLVAVANSALVLRFYDLACGNQLYAGRRRWMTQYVNRLPLPDPDSRSARRLVALSRELCTSPDHPDPQLIHQVDALVEAGFRHTG